MQDLFGSCGRRLFIIENISQYRGQKKGKGQFAGGGEDFFFLFLFLIFLVFDLF